MFYCIFYFICDRPFSRFDDIHLSSFACDSWARARALNPSRCRHCYDVIGSRDVISNVTIRFCAETFLSAPNTK